VRWRAFLDKRMAYKRAKRDGTFHRCSARSSTAGLEPTPVIDLENIQRHAQELFDERAAIMEMDGGLALDEARSRDGDFVTHSLGPNAAFHVVDYSEESSSDVPF
jgi:hypothetical protein